MDGAFSHTRSESHGVTGLLGNDYSDSGAMHQHTNSMSESDPVPDALPPSSTIATNPPIDVAVDDRPREPALLQLTAAHANGERMPTGELQLQAYLNSNPTATFYLAEVEVLCDVVGPGNGGPGWVCLGMLQSAVRMLFR